LPAPFFIRLLFQESGFKPGIVSHAGAQGIAQFMPETAASVGLRNPFDPLQAIPAAARFLRNLVDKFGNLGLAAAAYNAGPGRIHSWLAHKSSLPNETKGYVKIITGKPAESWKGTKSADTATKLPAEAPCKNVVVVANAADPAPAPEPAPAPAKHVAHTHRAAKPHVAAAKAPARAKPHGVTKVVAESETAAEKKAAKLAAQKSTVNLAAKAHRTREHHQRLASR
jgi:hypothetical protein